MSKEAYQKIKKISGEELKEILSDLDYVFDLGTCIFLESSHVIPNDF